MKPESAPMSKAEKRVRKLERVIKNLAYHANGVLLELNKPPAERHDMHIVRGNLRNYIDRLPVVTR